MATPPLGEAGLLIGMNTRPPDEPVYHVYDVGGRWAVQRDGATSVMTRTDNRDEAVMLARKLAGRKGFGHVILHRADGSIEAAYPCGDGFQPTCG